MCRMSELITVVGLVGVPLQIPAPVVVQRPQLTPTLEAAQLRRCPARPLGGRCPDPPAPCGTCPPPPQPDLLPFPWAPCWCQTGALWPGSISQFRGTRSLCSALSWALARSPSRLVWFSSQRLSAQCPRLSVARTRDRACQDAPKPGVNECLLWTEFCFYPFILLLTPGKAKGRLENWSRWKSNERHRK